MSNRIDIRNDRQYPVTVWVEPWGEDYTLLPGESYSFTAATPAEGFHYSINWQDRDMQLYADVGCEEVLATHNSVELSCGHNRQHRTDREF